MEGEPRRLKVGDDTRCLVGVPLSGDVRTAAGDSGLGGRDECFDGVEGMKGAAEGEMRVEVLLVLLLLAGLWMLVDDPLPGDWVVVDGGWPAMASMGAGLEQREMREGQ